ncbi:glycosyltransferase [Alistipes senegalensis]|jgi:glycoside transferase family 2|uniref:glycosyltransferase n=1 Tax=Alistipes senegalensis TaxID=1288121 RepID=UPI00248DB0D0|nr:glycosyltransferase [Alistipes senegalensis]
MNEFSVLISIYYKESPLYFREALNSVFAQTLQPAEIVLVKDGPLTPELDAVIEEYSTRYPIFKIVTNETNLGLGLALAKGLSACSYEYVARMDTDDLIAPTRFEKEIRKLDEGYDVVSCWTKIFEDDLSHILCVRARPEFHDDIVRLAKRRSPINHPGAVFRKSAVLKAGNYQHCLLFEDYHLWVRMILSGAKFYNVPEPLYYFRYTSAAMKRRGGFQYMVTETKTMFYFYKLGFYSFADFIINTMMRSSIRIMPLKLRSWMLHKSWERQKPQKP